MITIQRFATVIRVILVTDVGLCLAEASRHGKRWACTAQGEDTVWVKDRAAAESWVRKVYLAAGGAP